MIQIDQISKRYGRKRVLEQVSFGAEVGEITCLIGLNGAGKSTILKAIMHLVPIDSGRIMIDGAARQPEELYEMVSFISDALSMPPRMKVGQVLAFMKEYYKGWNQERAADMLRFFKLDASSRIGDLSKGNAAKLNLLLGLGINSRYVLMDEPFSGIDMFSREQIADVFTSDLVEDRGVIITTHEIKDIEHLIDKAVMLENGTIIREFAAEDMRLQAGQSIVDVMREVYRQ